MGDPGSGKSVSLRSLVRELCKQAKRTGVVPVYVNLREYPSNRPFTTEGLVSFTQQEAYRQTGRDGRTFLDKWYDQFRKNSQLFFVIDSFDELPSVLDSDDRSDSHKKTSAAFDRFFTQEIQSCRAVLASRNFRAPVGIKGVRLVIRPFKESQIRRAMETWLVDRQIDTNRYIRRLFREKPQLVPHLRNPFTAELIAEYAKSVGEDNLPDSLVMVFDKYIVNRLDEDKPKLEELNLTTSQVKGGAALIAESMYRFGKIVSLKNETIGLEADFSWVKDTLQAHGEPQSESIIEALRYSRIARVGGRTRQRFAFVHRRFAEFFVVKSIEETEKNLNIESIPTDSRWRDCLVMYCSISKPHVRQRIANYCWLLIKEEKYSFLSGDLDNARQAVHCLRFLTDAFRGDLAALSTFRVDLSSLVIELLETQDYLVAKIGAEAISLVDHQMQQHAINLAFKSQSVWIQETAFRSCRHLNTISKSSKTSIRKYLRDIPTLDFVKRFRDLRFSMSLSDVFQDIKLSLWLDMLELTLIGISFLVMNITYFMILQRNLSGLIYLVVLVIFSSCGDRSKITLNYYKAKERDEIIKSRKIRRRKIKLLLKRKFNYLEQPLAEVEKSRIMEEITSGMTSIKCLNPRDAVESFIQSFLILSCCTILTIVTMPDVTLLAPKLEFGVVETILDGIFKSHFLELPPNLSEYSRQFIGLSFLPIFLFFMAGWEMSFKLIRNPIRLMVRFIKFPKALIFLLTTIACLYIFLISLLGLMYVTVQYILFDLFRLNEAIVASLIVYSFFTAIFFVLASYSVVLTIKMRQRRKESEKLKSHHFPDTITCKTAYAFCLSFKDLYVRKVYLEQLRLKRIPLKGAIVEPPSELIGDRHVSEELARLREQWYGLAA